MALPLPVISNLKNIPWASGSWGHSDRLTEAPVRNLDRGHRIEPQRVQETTLKIIHLDWKSPFSQTRLKPIQGSRGEESQDPRLLSNLKPKEPETAEQPEKTDKKDH